MKDIVIICAGGFGVEALAFIRSLNEQARKEEREAPYRVLGFLDDNADTLKGKNIDYPILGSISDWTPKGGERYVLGASGPAAKEKLASMLKARGCEFETIIAPWSVVAPSAVIGEGCLISAYRIASGVTLGRFVNAAGSMLCAGARIGDYSTVTGFSVVENAAVGRRVFIGSHAVVPDGVTVGDDVTISAGSIVMNDLPDGAKVFGCPAREF